MSTVPEQDESTQKIILPESYSYSGMNGPPPTTTELRPPLNDGVAMTHPTANG
ncbi:unnamed protein product, partial [Nippostrongylus brasiliensis]|uniref:Uncharacterized protein n=1 Tax=Nippostrongylus brasiliensis TaxID=27835 RepID=A0A0N4XKC2_NIPBR